MIFSATRSAWARGNRARRFPCAARIVALADVYDALGSKRSYKDSFPEDQTLEYIRGQSGKHFDPEVVRAFLEIYDVIVAIKEKYQEDPSASFSLPPDPVSRRAASPA